MGLRILMVTDSYKPLIGGATRDTALLSQQLTQLRRCPTSGQRARATLCRVRPIERPAAAVLIGAVSTDTPREFPNGTTVLLNVPHGTVMAAWERALFGVVPSMLPEPLGNVVHEGMSKGKAMIGTAPDGMDEMIVDGETGLLVPVGDVDALRVTMQRLIDDAPLRDRLGQAARPKAEPFTAAVVMPRFEKLYRQLIRVGTLQ